MSEQPDNQTKSIHTGGGSLIEGDVETGSGDFVGRDKVTIGTVINNLFRGDSEEVRKLRNRQAMLKLVYDIWVKGVLEHSLYNQLLIDLDMEQRPEAVERPWGMVLETPTQADRLLPSGTKMVTVFAELNQSLLILGEPGSGKSTMLLELARDLIIQATQNPALPIPVLFNLSSWADKRPPIRQWLVDELREKYQIPKALAQAWIEQDELLLLLDGLDEVKQAHREECINALNEFQQSCKTRVPLALCSRTAEYATLTSKLKLNGAIVLHSLTEQQIDTFLAKSGDKLSAVVYLLQHDVELKKLAQSPLILSIVCLTYQDKTIADVQPLDTGGMSLQHLFNTYILHMFVHRRREHLYSTPKTLSWLRWLAHKMNQVNQTIFLIEDLQPTWLSSNSRKLYIMVSRVATGFILGFSLIGHIPNMRVNLGILLAGLLGGVITGIIDILFHQHVRASSKMSQWKSLLSYGLPVGLSTGIPIGFASAVFLNRSFHTFAGLTFGLFFAIVSSQQTMLRLENDIQRREILQWSWTGAGLGITLGLLGGLLLGCVFTLVSGFANGFIYGAIFTFAVLLMFSLRTGKIEKINFPNQGIIIMLKNSLFVGLLFGVGVFLALTAYFGWRSLISYGIRVGLRTGITVSIIVMLWYGLQGILRHLSLRLLLWWNDYMPLNYAHFLDYCTDRMFLRKVGGGYTFFHRLLMEHFASLTEEDIKRLAAASEKR